MKQLDDSVQNHLADAVAHLFSAKNNLRLNAVKRIKVFKNSFSDKLNEEKKKITDLRKGK